MNGLVSKHIRSILILGGGAVLSKCLGFLRNFALGFQFGAGEISDAFLLTAHIPEVMFGAIVTAASMNFIPAYMTMGDKEARDRFASNILNTALVIALLGLIVAEMFPRQIVRIFAFELPEETMGYAVVLLRLNMCMVIPLFAWHLFQAYLQANRIFFTTAAAGNVINIVLCIFILASERDTYYRLGIGIVLAHCAALLLTCAGMRGSRFSYQWVLDFRDPSLRHLCVLSVPLALEKLIWGMNLLVDRNLASSMGVGVISSMMYASLLANAVGVVLLNPVATTVFPVFAKLAAEAKWDEMSAAFWKYFRLLCVLLVPGSVFMSAFSGDIVTCILRHGAMDDAAAAVISDCLLFYAVGSILFWGMQDFCFRYVYARRDNWTTVKIRALAVSCNILLSVLFSRLWGWQGIAAATSMSYAVSCAALLYVFGKSYSIKMPSGVFKDISCMILFTVLAAAILHVLAHDVLCTENVFLQFAVETVGFAVGCTFMLILRFKDELSAIVFPLRQDRAGSRSKI